MSSDAWESGVAYERFMGRWSRLASAAFVRWLDRPAGGVWIDVGMGTGALTQSILDTEQPAQVIGVEPSSAFREVARGRVTDPRVTIVTGDASSIPLPDDVANTVASSFVLNFVPDAMAALREMRRCVRAGGSVAAVVWDYAEGMGFLRHFWTAAVELDPDAQVHDQGNRFPICRPGPLEAAFDAARLLDVHVEAIEVETRFADLSDFWEPFLGGTGSAPAYLASLSAPNGNACTRNSRRGSPWNRTGAFICALALGPSAAPWEPRTSERERGRHCGARTRDRASTAPAARAAPHDAARIASTSSCLVMPLRPLMSSA